MGISGRVKLEGRVATVGVTDFAQDQRGDLAFVGLPGAGENIEAGGSMGSVESVKAASDLYSPVSGEIIEVNGALEASPELVNSDPYGAGWLIEIEITDPSQLKAMMSGADYKQHLIDNA